jgi:hypothetical protein
MSRTQNMILAPLVAVLAVAAVAPATGVAYAAAGERTATELSQAVGEPDEQGSAATNALYSRTPSELGQRVATSVAPGAKSSGFNWGDAAIGAGATLALIGFGGAVGVLLVNRRRQAIRSSTAPALPA